MEVKILGKRTSPGTALPCGVSFPLCPPGFLPALAYLFQWLLSSLVQTGLENHKVRRENLLKNSTLFLDAWELLGAVGFNMI